MSRRDKIFCFCNLQIFYQGSKFLNRPTFLLVCEGERIWGKTSSGRRKKRETKEGASKILFSVGFDLHWMPEQVNVKEQISLLRETGRGSMVSLAGVPLLNFYYQVFKAFCEGFFHLQCESTECSECCLSPAASLRLAESPGKLSRGAHSATATGLPLAELLLAPVSTHPAKSGMLISTTSLT